MVGSDNNTIVGCHMTDASGAGIHLYESSSNTMTENDVSSLSGPGIWVARGSGNTIHSNNASGAFVGIALTDSDNSPVVGNDVSGATYCGISLTGTSAGNVIQGNNVSGSSGTGIRVAGGSGNRIYDNSIHSNDGLGIDLGTDWVVTLNDADDADTGANNLQNFPEIMEAEAFPTQTRVAGTLDSLPDKTFAIDFYASSEADPSGYGEGERWLGAITVSTDANGDADFDAVLPAATTPGEVITATATEDLPVIAVDPGTPDDPSDDYTIHPGNTSEFSAAMPIEQGFMVEIDIKPGSDSNPVNLNSNGVITVAILADANFDPSCVQVDTVVFAGAYAIQHAFEDVDADGDLDLVMHFRIEDTNLDEIYQQLLEDDQNADGVLDSTHQEVQAWLFGQAGDELFAGVDDMDVFLSGKNLRELLDELFGAGAA
jgi:parallel beta-helix repeat protein